MVFSACAFSAQQLAKDWAERLDASSAKFVGAQASFHKDNFTKIVNDHDYQDGITYAKRGPAGTEVGIKIVKGGARTIVYKGGTATDFNAGTGCYNKYEGGKNKGTIESLLALSFGASGKELKAAWTVTDKGQETMDGVKVEVLDLIPKDPGLRNNIKSITLWTDLDTAVSHKQVVYAPSGDTQTGTYSNIVLTRQPDTKPFDFKGKPCGK
jgi:hypothetical protein